MRNQNEYAYNFHKIDPFYKETNSSKRFLYKFIRQNIKKSGNLFEFGVYRGSSLLAVACILKELGSKKKVFGFDSFYGFPKYSKEDDMANFYKLEHVFSRDFLNKFEEFKLFHSIFNQNILQNQETLAESGDFSKNNLQLLKNKIEYFGLDNIELIEGPFDTTVPLFFKNYKNKILACNIDCDLYAGYKISLPYVYKNLVRGGYIHLDEYFSFKYPGAKIACDEFALKNSLDIKFHSTRKGEFKRFYIIKN